MRRERGGEWGWGREIIYLSLHCRHQSASCIKMGSDESHFNVPERWGGGGGKERGGGTERGRREEMGEEIWRGRQGVEEGGRGGN